MLKINKFFIILICLVVALSTPALAEEIKLTGGVGLDWPLKNQAEREKAIKHYRELLFKKPAYKINKKQLKSFKKDPNYWENRNALKRNIRTLSNRQLAGFYALKRVLVVYGVKYNNDKFHIYYYNALGNLAFYDVLDKPHDEFPHIANQYNSKGKFVGTSYYITDYDQYVFDAKKKFKGRWYNEKLYDKRAKVLMLRKLP